MRVGVVGGTGVVGSLLCRSFAAAGVEVVALSRRRRAMSVPWQPFDLTTPALAPALDGMDAVVNAAGLFEGSALRLMHVGGTRNLLAACRAAGVRRLIHLSALRAGPRSLSEYGQTKHAAEELVRGSDLDFTIVRADVLFGRGDRCVEAIAALADRGGPIPLLAGARAHLQPTALVDLVAVCRIALEAPETYGLAYDLPGPEALTAEQLVGRVLDALEIERPLVHVSAAELAVRAPALVAPPLELPAREEEGGHIGDSLPARLAFDFELTHLDKTAIASILSLSSRIAERPPFTAR